MPADVQEGFGLGGNRGGPKASLDLSDIKPDPFELPVEPFQGNGLVSQFQDSAGLLQINCAHMLILAEAFQPPSDLPVPGYDNLPVHSAPLHHQAGQGLLPLLLIGAAGGDGPDLLVPSQYHGEGNPAQEPDLGQSQDGIDDGGNTRFHIPASRAVELVPFNPALLERVVRGEDRIHVPQEVDGLAFLHGTQQVEVADLRLLHDPMYREKAPDSGQNHLGDPVGSGLVVREAILVAEVYDELELLGRMVLDEGSDSLPDRGVRPDHECWTR